jgi:hypothetical protein
LHPSNPSLEQENPDKVGVFRVDGNGTKVKQISCELQTDVEKSIRQSQGNLKPKSILATPANGWQANIINRRSACKLNKSKKTRHIAGEIIS